MTATTGSKNYALKFISGKYQGGEFPLRSDKEILIGRSSELDMVLVEDMVSRKHAKIALQEGKVTISDLGSTNGTFVNGEKVKQARLKEGDRILIGTSILKLVIQDAGAKPLDDHEVRSKLDAIAAAERPKAGAMTGRLEEVPLPDLLQLFQTSKKTGMLVVQGNGHDGRIYLRQGRAFYAVIDGNRDVAPAKAFFRMILWDRGTFTLDPLPENESFPQELEGSTEALLMEGLRQLDELKRIEKDLPPRSAGLMVAMPLVPPLRELKPAELDVLQLVYNYGSMAVILDRSAHSDYDTSAAVLHLLKKDYIRPA